MGMLDMFQTNRKRRIKTTRQSTILRFFAPAELAVEAAFTFDEKYSFALKDINVDKLKQSLIQSITSGYLTKSIRTHEYLADEDNGRYETFYYIPDVALHILRTEKFFDAAIGIDTRELSRYFEEESADKWEFEKIIDSLQYSKGKFYTAYADTLPVPVPEPATMTTILREWEQQKQRWKMERDSLIEFEENLHTTPRHYRISVHPEIFDGRYFSLPSKIEPGDFVTLALISDPSKTKQRRVIQQFGFPPWLKRAEW